MSEFIPSLQQKTIYEWALDSKGSANVVARAGCGKTTTPLALTQLLSKERRGSIFLGAYNKSIATEIQGRLANLRLDWKQARAATLHSAGYSAWRKVAPEVKIDSDKIDGIIFSMLSTGDYEDGYEEDFLKTCPKFIRKTISLAKQRGFGYCTPG